jgi:hypothetical protein
MPQAMVRLRPPAAVAGRRRLPGSHGPHPGCRREVSQTLTGKTRATTSMIADRTHVPQHWRAPRPGRSAGCDHGHGFESEVCPAPRGCTRGPVVVLVAITGVISNRSVSHTTGRRRCPGHGAGGDQRGAARQSTCRASNVVRHEYLGRNARNETQGGVHDRAAGWARRGAGALRWSGQPAGVGCDRVRPVARLQGVGAARALGRRGMAI